MLIGAVVAETIRWFQSASGGPRRCAQSYAARDPANGRATALTRSPDRVQSPTGSVTPGVLTRVT